MLLTQDFYAESSAVALREAGYTLMSEAVLMVSEARRSGRALVLEAGDDSRLLAEVNKYVGDVRSRLVSIAQHDDALEKAAFWNLLSAGTLLASGLMGLLVVGTGMTGAGAAVLVVLAIIGFMVGFVSATIGAQHTSTADDIAVRMRSFRDRLVAAEQHAPAGKVRDKLRWVMEQADEVLVKYEHRHGHRNADSKGQVAVAAAMILRDQLKTVL